MSAVYVVLLGWGWGYIGNHFHWGFKVTFVAVFMTLIFAFYVSRVVHDDRERW